METSFHVPFDIPFYTQRVTEDTFAAMGFASAAEGESWSCRGCGIASLRMIVDGIRVHRGIAESCGTQGAVLHLGLQRGAYQEGVGWIHQGLAAMAAEFGVKAEAVRGISVERLAQEIEQGKPCIVSVSPRFAGGELRPDGTPVPRSGHLVPVYGTVREDGGLTAFLTHHPSCFAEFNWPERRVPIQQFDASFSGNCLVFDPKGCVCHENR